MTRFFTSDLHLGHQAIINFAQRPFHSVENMNRLLVAQWNERVLATDEVLILGDLAMGRLADTLPLVARLRGIKRLVPGNHDRMFGQVGAKLGKWLAVYESYGIMVTDDDWFDMEVGGHEVRVSHFPYRGDHTTEDRYVEARPPDIGHVLLHGHTHGVWGKTNGRMIDVGTDLWNYCPVSEAELLPLIEAASGV